MATVDSKVATFARHPHELEVNIVPREYAEWTGSADALLAEGLIPGKVTWPEGRRADVTWKAGDFKCWLRPARGAVGRWTLRMTPIERPPEPSEVYLARVQYERALFAQTAEASTMQLACCRSEQDLSYQAFRAALLGLEPGGQAERRARR